MSTTNTLAIPEGTLFYKHELPSTSSTTSKPTLLFLHAGVATHALWDAQVTYFLSQGYPCLRADRFGFGLSRPSSSYLASKPPAPINHVSQTLFLLNSVLPPSAKVVAIGLSMGAGLALQFATSHPERVLGVAVMAGALPGFEFENAPEEDNLFEQVGALLSQKKAKEAGLMQVRIWLDGPLQPEGRVALAVRQRMVEWCVAIAGAECGGTGGDIFEEVGPAVVDRLQEINVPVAVAWGVYDESSCTAAMKVVAEKVGQAEAREFETAHMINLEREEETNLWLGGWVQRNFGG